MTDCFHRSLHSPYSHEKQRFSLGHIVVTPAAVGAIHEAGQTPEFFLDRHAQADWGEVCAEDQEQNDRASTNGHMLMSEYRTLKDVRIWVITGAADPKGKREATTILLPEEY